MSSTEIAELTGKEKKTIHRDIKEQILVNLYGYDFKDGTELHHLKIQGLEIDFDSRGYWKEVLLDRYHTDILISGYEVKYRAAIVKRWHELENKPLTIVDYARALVETHDKIKALENEQKITQSVLDEKIGDVRWLEDRLERELENKRLYGWKK